MTTEADVKDLFMGRSDTEASRKSGLGKTRLWQNVSKTVSRYTGKKYWQNGPQGAI